MKENASEMTDDINDTEDERTFKEDMADFFQERAADREDEARMDAEEEEKFKRHTNQDGDFKSLKDAMQFYGDDLSEDLGPGSPDPADYGPENLEQFEADVRAFRESGGTRLSGGLTAFADDPHTTKRMELMREFSEWTDKQIAAEEAGNLDAIDRAKHFKRGIARELNELPEPPAVSHGRKLNEARRKEALEMAFDEQTAFEDFWRLNRIRNDATIEAARHILESDDLSTIYVPAETSPHSSNFLPFTPQNAIKFSNLSENLQRQIKQTVRDRNASTPDEVNNAVMGVLHRTGYAAQGQRSPAYNDPKPKTPKTSVRKPKKGSSAASITVRAGMFPS